MSSAKSFPITLVKTKQLSTKVSMFYFSKPESFTFVGGQYLQLTLPHDADDRGTTRFFSIASSPKEKHLMLTIKEGKSSFKKKLFSLEEGAEVNAFGPIGKFTLED